MHTSNIIWTEQTTVGNRCVYPYMHIITVGEMVIDLKESGDNYTREGWREEREVKTVVIIL